MPWLLFLIVVFLSETQLDINRATLDEIRGLPVDSLTALRIYEYRELYRRFNSIYDLLKVPGITLEKLDELKPLVYISPRGWEERREANIQRIQKRLATEDGPSAVLVEDWQDFLVDPLNINRATVDDLLRLENVSLIDAVAVVRYINSGGRIESRRDLTGQVPGLSTYGYRGMRNYIKFTDQERRRGWSTGNYRLKFASSSEEELDVTESDFISALSNLVMDSAAFRESGWNAEGIEFLRQRLAGELEFLRGLNSAARFQHRLRMRVGEKVRLAGWVAQPVYERKIIGEAKGYLALDGIAPLRRLILGDYRVTLGQGLVMDNNYQLLPRVYNQGEGIFGDLSENPNCGLRGIAGDFNIGRIWLTGFYSRAKRDAILNPDSTVNWYIITQPRYPTFKDVVLENGGGGNLRFDLSNLLFLPLGTRLGVNFLSLGVNRDVKPTARFIDLPGDAEVLDDPCYLRLDSGRTRLFYSAEWRTVIENFSVEGEFAHQHNGGNAVFVKARTQYDYLYLNALFRRYDVNYNNPYNRGFCEELRFQNTILEKPYRLVDPAYSALQDFPMPKAEEGIMLETRYQISRAITFTRAYLDIWRNLGSGTDNYRFQGEVEYRPVFPVRLRFKQKVQFKENKKQVVATHSMALESSIRMMLSLSNWGYFTGEVRFSKTRLTPTLRYNDEASINGDFVALQWEHNFSEDFSSELGVASWRSAGMSEWLFEDTGIDFIDGRGFKWYLAFTDRISDYLLVYVKLRHKVSQFPHFGLGNNEGVHYRDGGWVKDFFSRDDRFDIRLQVDFLW